MVRTNKKIEEFDFKASGGSISGTVFYMGKLTGTRAVESGKLLTVLAL